MPVVHRIRMDSVNCLQCVLGYCIRCDQFPWTVVHLKLATLHHVIEETPPNVDVLGSRTDAGILHQKDCSSVVFAEMARQDGLTTGHFVDQGSQELDVLTQLRR
jgi:hypothetical protein